MSTSSKFLHLFLLISLTSCAPARWVEYKNQTEEGLGNQKPNPGVKHTESFFQDEGANKVDILIINDNSRSMDNDQQKMSERFGSFVSAISDVDYQIAMTTTDIETKKWALNGKILPWNETNSKILTPQTANADEAFRATVPRKETIGCGTRNSGRDCPSGVEQPLKVINLAVNEATGANSGFFRSGVDFVVVILSDEDEMSDGPSKATKPFEVVKHFKSVFGESKRFNVHGIIIKPGDTGCKAEQDAEIKEGHGSAFGTHVAELARLTGGTTSSICDKDYSENLSAISEQVKKLVGTFELKQTPRPGSVSVITTPAQEIAFRIEGNKLIFDTPPLAGTHLEITYTAK